MDLLGSILNSMDKPPTASEKQKELYKSKYTLHFINIHINKFILCGISWTNIYQIFRNTYFFCSKKKKNCFLNSRTKWTTSKYEKTWNWRIGKISKICRRTNTSYQQRWKSKIHTISTIGSSISNNCVRKFYRMKKKKQCLMIKMIVIRNFFLFLY